MRIQSVNNSSQSFGAKTEYGNYYEKSDLGKTLGFGLGVGCIATNILHDGGFKEFAQDFHKKLDVLARDEYQVGDRPFTKFRNKGFKVLANKEMVGYVALLVIGSTLAGGILDAIINAGRRDSADGRF